MTEPTPPAPETAHDAPVDSAGRERASADRFANRALVGSVTFVAVTFLALFLWYSVYVLFLLFAGVLLAILLRALADVVSHFTPLSHRWSLGVVLLAIALLAAGFWMVAAPRLSEQAADLSGRLPGAWKNFQAKAQETPIGRMVVGGQAPATQASATQPTTQPAGHQATQPASQPAAGQGQAGTSADAGGGDTGGGAASGGSVGSGGGGGGGWLTGEILGRFGRFIASVLDVLGALIVVLFTGLFLAFDPKLYVRGTIRLVPPAYRLRAGEVLGALGYTLKWWLIGQGIMMVVVAAATSVGLMLLGVDLAFVLGVIAGVFNFIPNFGPLFSMVPATLLALTVSPGTALAVIVMFLVIQNVEGNVLTPMIQRKSVDLPPAVGIIAQILLGILVGPIGLILAWPIAAVAVLAVKMLYVEDVLGDELPTPDDDLRVREVRQAKREARSVERDEKKDERG